MESKVLCEVNCQTTAAMEIYEKSLRIIKSLQGFVETVQPFQQSGIPGP